MTWSAEPDNQELDVGQGCLPAGEMPKAGHARSHPGMSIQSRLPSLRDPSVNKEIWKTQSRLQLSYNHQRLAGPAKRREAHDTADAIKAVILRMKSCQEIDSATQALLQVLLF